MRIAAMAVGAAVAGASAMLLVLPPPQPTQTGRFTAIAPTPAEASLRDTICPPCDRGPMGPIGWSHAAVAPDALQAIERATALSLAFAEPQMVLEALQAEDAALRELAALLLNVASGRVAGCTPFREGEHVAGALDQLDRLLHQVGMGEPVEAAALERAVRTAAAVNRGEGLPPECN